MVVWTAAMHQPTTTEPDAKRASPPCSAVCSGRTSSMVRAVRDRAMFEAGPIIASAMSGYHLKLGLDSQHLAVVN